MYITVRIVRPTTNRNSKAKGYKMKNNWSDFCESKKFKIALFVITLICFQSDLIRTGFVFPVLQDLKFTDLGFFQMVFIWTACTAVLSLVSAIFAAVAEAIIYFLGLTIILAAVWISRKSGLLVATPPESKPQG